MTINIQPTPTGSIAALTGRLDTAASAQFSIDIQPLIEHAEQELILDCAALEYISSTGLRLLLTLRKAATAKGGKVIIRNLSDDIKKVFTITGFNSLFDFE